MEKGTDTIVAAVATSMLSTIIKLLENKILEKKIKLDCSDEIIKEKNEELKKVFVKTLQYKEAIKYLESENSIILQGCSGIGKSDTSIMLANHFVDSKKYKINGKFSRLNENDFKDIKKYIIEKKIKKEIFIFDDFLGDTKSNRSKKYLSELYIFLEEIKYLTDNKFIFNTRKTILDSVKADDIELEFFISESIKMINLEEWYESEDKLNIFARYCHKYKINNNILILLEENDWLIILNKIIEHKNFTPFLIQHAIKKCMTAEISEYQNIILNSLDNPTIIWEKSLRELDDFSYKYILILYSFSDTNVKRKIVDESYQKYMEEIDALPNVTLPCIHNCIQSFVTYNTKNDIIEFIHPSIIDYLDNRNILSDQRKKILESAIYLEQIEKLDYEKRYIRNLMSIDEISKKPSILKFKVLPKVYYLEFIDMDCLSFPNNIEVQYLKHLYELKIEKKEHEEIVLKIINKILDPNYSSFIDWDIIINALKLNYNFSEIFTNETFMKKICIYANSNNVFDLISLIMNKNEEGYDFLEMNESIQSTVIEALKDVGEEAFCLWIENQVDQYIEVELENFFYSDDRAYTIFENMIHEFDIDISSQAIINKANQFSIYNYPDISNDLELENSVNAQEIIERVLKNYCDS